MIGANNENNSGLLLFFREPRRYKLTCWKERINEKCLLICSDSSCCIAVFFSGNQSKAEKQWKENVKASWSLDSQDSLEVFCPNDKQTEQKKLRQNFICARVVKHSI